jgi:glycosyltransferase involved in cell wall biosynthesis
VERSFFGTSQILECGNHNLMRRSYTIYNGVNVNQIVSVVNEINQDEVRTQFGAKSDDFVIGIVARLIRWKGHQELIRAVHLAVKQNTSIKLWIIGWGELEENLKSLTESLELDHHVAFLGKQGNVYSILKGMDLFVLPYYYKGLFKGEGVGIAILEAMSAGLPIISTRVPGIERAVLSGKTGFVVKQGDIQSLCDKILWMKNYPAEKHRMGMEAQRWVKNHYSLETMVKRYEFLYEQLLRYSQ